jgi:hypothetical protein
VISGESKKAKYEIATGPVLHSGAFRVFAVRFLWMTRAHLLSYKKTARRESALVGHALLLVEPIAGRLPLIVL